MGCGASKSSIDVLPVDSTTTTTTTNKQTFVKPLNAKPVLKPIPRKDTNIDDAESDDRPNSTSSRDSGYADNEYKNIITEKSNPDLIKKVENEFKERQSLSM
jgi:hypothetical protein